MDNQANAYPLHWPDGWPRTEENKRESSTKFKVEVGQAIRELYDELERLGAKNIVLSSNLTLNTLHRPYAKQKKPDDPGIAVYFTLKDRPMVMARDGFADWRDNIRSLGLAVEAFRALHRHGGAHMMERAFTGFAALEAPKEDEHWSVVLQIPAHSSTAEVEKQYKRRRSEAHDDKGGNPEEFDKVQKAYQQFKAERGLNNGNNG